MFPFINDEDLKKFVEQYDLKTQQNERNLIESHRDQVVNYSSCLNCSGGTTVTTSIAVSSKSQEKQKSIRKAGSDLEFAIYDNCDVSFAQFFELMNGKIQNHGGIDFEQAEKSVSCFFTSPQMTSVVQN